MVLLLALAIDRLDRGTWSVANEQLRRIVRIESTLGDIASTLDDLRR
ncbi:MAG: hypothetical protein HY778_04430 [Betaproteobacteria bacterium]|nr:hypothetical protein [Betaproteobacteria bacterium]